ENPKTLPGVAKDQPSTHPASEVKQSSLAETGPSDPKQKMYDLWEQTAKAYGPMDSYIVRFRRREVFKGKEPPEEVILMKFRKEPWSSYMKWIGQAGEGREVFYVKTRYENQVHTIVGAGDPIFSPAGKRVSLPVDSPLIKNASRHPVSDA